MPYHLSIHILLYVQNNWFGLWTSLNCLGTVQIVLNRTKHFYNWILPSYIQTNWTCSKQFGPGQNRFGPVEGQGIRKKKSFYLGHVFEKPFDVGPLSAQFALLPDLARFNPSSIVKFNSFGIGDNSWDTWRPKMEALN